MDAAAVEAAFTNALAMQPVLLDYPKYKTSDDFAPWMAGFYARVRGAYGFGIDGDEKVKAEVCRSIAGNFSVGAALDSYNLLTLAEKTDYDLLTARLNEEFVDTHERRLFIENMAYNRRKSGQKLKEFIQEIKNDMDRYSGISDKIMQGATQIPNPEKEKQGVRRFRAGMRDSRGKKDKTLNRQLLFHLMEDDDLTWKNALEFASRWEIASGVEDPSTTSLRQSSSSSPLTSEINGAAAGAIAEEENLNIDNDCLASFANQIQENTRKIERIEFAQAELSAMFEGMRETVDQSFLLISALSEKMEFLFQMEGENESA